jgi:hypothetical protein
MSMAIGKPRRSTKGQHTFELNYLFSLALCK